MEWTALFKSALLLFAIVNPVGSIPLFLQLTQGMDRMGRMRTFRIAVITSIAILLIFVLIGEKVLTGFFGVTLYDLMAAGGLLLLIIAVDHLVFGSLVRGVLGRGQQDAHHIGAVPIACPILAGPGAMMTVLVIFSKYGLLTVAGSVVAVFAVTWFILQFIDGIYRFLGEIVCTVLSKILCLFIAAIGFHLLMQAMTYYFT